MKITTAKTAEDLRGILSLQQANLSKSISEAELQDQGFVTVEHDFETLKKMNSPYPHVIAKDGDEVVGYALTMLREVKDFIPVLIPMFDKINEISFEENPLGESKYVVMGQVCIAKSHRGQGVFYKLYDFYKKQFASDFDFVITEVSERNTRSMRAHEKAGFETILRFSDETDDWAIVLLRLKDA